MDIRSLSINAILQTNRSLEMSDEGVLQDQIDELLQQAMGVGPVGREVRLSDRDRIDFLICGLGIEVKTKGTLAQLTTQMHRYAQHDAIHSLLAVVTRGRLTKLPETLNGKQVTVLHLSWGAI